MQNPFLYFKTSPEVIRRIKLNNAIMESAQSDIDDLLALKNKISGP